MLLQPLNKPSAILSTQIGIFILTRLVQFENAQFPINVMLSGIDMLARLVQPSNASFPIEVTLSGIDTLSRLVQPLNASFPIEVTLSGIITYESFPSYFNNLPNKVLQFFLSFSLLLHKRVFAYINLPQILLWKMARFEKLSFHFSLKLVVNYFSITIRIPIHSASAASWYCDGF